MRRMNMKTKILIALLTLTLLTTTANAHEDDDEFFKEQCQYIVDRKGSNYEFIAGVMQGFIDGITYKLPMQNATDFARTTKRESITKKACQNTLEKNKKNGFAKYFQEEVYNLIVKK
jgi:hypothetical protein